MFAQSPTLLLHSPSWPFAALAPSAMARVSWCARSCPPHVSRGSSRACAADDSARVSAPCAKPALAPSVIVRASWCARSCPPDASCGRLVHVLLMPLLACPPRVVILAQECRTALTRPPPAALAPILVVHGEASPPLLSWRGAPLCSSAVPKRGWRPIPHTKRRSRT